MTMMRSFPVERKEGTIEYKNRKKSQNTPSVFSFFLLRALTIVYISYYAKFKCVVQTNPQIWYVQPISYAFRVQVNSCTSEIFFFFSRYLTVIFNFSSSNLLQKPIRRLSIRSWLAKRGSSGCFLNFVNTQFRFFQVQTSCKTNPRIQLSQLVS